MTAPPEETTSFGALSADELAALARIRLDPELAPEEIRLRRGGREARAGVVAFDTLAMCLGSERLVLR